MGRGDPQVTRKPWNAAVAKLGLGAKPRDFIVELSNTISPLPSPKYVENKLYAARAAARRGPAEEKAFRSRDAAVTLGILARRSRSMRLSRSLSTPIENRIIFISGLETFASPAPLNDAGGGRVARRPRASVRR